MTENEVTSEALIDGIADAMYVDVRDLAEQLRDIAEYGDNIEQNKHFWPVKDFLSQCGYPIANLEDAADTLAGFAETGSPTMVMSGHEKEWGRDEWDNLGMGHYIDSEFESLIEDTMDYKKFGFKLLQRENRTKASYGKTDLWVLHN